ncbi:hypothetical protein HF086_007210 [Spodoptera exigua]|uniref:Uncharacterized protein n=1 Tax=Spodoptera exigua TaxID=7107 RepID=A0A922MTM7_SPOEX|nr:hypothetical protein HF086_007210 [Spodoptera exigua]
MASTQPVKRPPTPELVRETRLRLAKTKRTHFGSSMTIQPQPQPQTSGITHQALSAAAAAPSKPEEKRTSSKDTQRQTAN